ncbi:hypothetical protein [Comamonas sp. JUb58]|uniref:hypothetical protein n=1 Tax=Comamonas sp. JUb58 TaxID=2485114 RepID=UPI00106163D6|nr:hypothetical protein [Comamonas sp. JUb58]TDS82613.1 hypothetical protein EDF71_107249 [Comamonas sp. JUb58]
MSIKEFVANLDLDQLSHCAEEVETRLRTLKEGEKVRLWHVDVERTFCFASPEPKEVIEWLQSFLAHRHASGELDRINVYPMSAYPCEVAGWVKGNEKPEDV